MGLQRVTCGLLNPMPPFLRIIQVTKDVADQSALHGQKREKGKFYVSLVEYFAFEYFFFKGKKKTLIDPIVENFAYAPTQRPKNQ